MAVKSHREALAPAKRSSPLSNWAALHAGNCVGSLGRLLRQPFASLLTVLVIAVTLALPAAMHLVIKNATTLSRSWENALDFSVSLPR